MKRNFYLFFFVIGCYFIMTSINAADAPKIQWNNWSDKVFTDADKQHRLVILDLEAVWCHWCHVMEQQTYDNPAIIKIIQNHFIAVRTDQDARPDLSIRYQDFGWPATIILNKNGQEIVELAGFIPPQRMQKILQAVIDNKGAATLKKTVDDQTINFSTQPFLTPTLRDELVLHQDTSYDTQNKGWGGKNGGQKYLDADNVEYAMTRAAAGNKSSETMAQETLIAQQALLDPVWGGVYQYSTDGDWVHPHFEKIMSFQARDLRVYALAYAQWHDPIYLETAEKIDAFLINFLTSPDGVFYTSQDADVIQGEHSAEYFKLDDAHRRALGMPRIDKHIYARENGWVIAALAQLYMATGNASYLNQATKAANWITANRNLADGGFRHDAKDIAGPYLSDTLAMGCAFLALYQATGDKQYLTRAQQAANFIDSHFKNSNDKPGYITAMLTGTKVTNEPQLDRDENVALTRFTNLLYHYTGKEIYKKMAEHSMLYLATTNIAKSDYPAPVLIADQEMSQDPLHITIIGDKNDPQVKNLYLTALAYPSSYKRVEWWDTKEGPLTNPDVEYPPLTKPAAFVCENHRCSLPVYNSADLMRLIKKLSLNTTAATH
jgi:uncharacterized protein YyaL (SSP411 family)